jgi:hypothetical protein
MFYETVSTQVGTVFCFGVLVGSTCILEKEFKALDRVLSSLVSSGYSLDYDG